MNFACIQYYPGLLDHPNVLIKFMQWNSQNIDSDNNCVAFH